MQVCIYEFLRNKQTRTAINYQTTQECEWFYMKYRKDTIHKQCKGAKLGNPVRTQTDTQICLATLHEMEGHKNNEYQACKYNDTRQI